MCQAFYNEINTDFGTPEAIKEAITWWQNDKNKLNELWWVLNYYADRLDPDRALRVVVEKSLDMLADKINSSSETKEDI